MSVHHGYWTSRLSNYAIEGRNARPLNPRVFSSAALCVQAARASIHLIKYVPQGDFQCVWLILYFPVSALVTLFGNILQNPQDPRARADVRLMSLVVNFLSMLGADEANGGVKRMLGVCSEFERIATVVLDKTEKESSSRRKRKGSEENKTKTSFSMSPNVPSHVPMTQVNSMANIFTPGNPPDMNLPNDFSPPISNGSPQNGVWQPEINGGNEYMSPPVNGAPAFTDMQGFQILNSSMNMNTFQRPFVPQDLWQMPMTLEWDWADMTGGAYPSFENGLVGDSGLHQNNN